MAQTPTLCCPKPAFNARHQHPVPNGSTGTPTTPGYACENPLFVTVCEGAPPDPTPITLEGQDCDGAPVDATGLPGQLTHVVQAPGTVFKVQVCDAAKDYEKVVLCDAITEHKVIVITDLTDPTAPVVSYWDINTGAPWTGDVADLVACPDIDLESDAQEMCDSGTQFLRWFVKKDGEPTGETFDTDLAGQPYTVGNEPAVTLGKCLPPAEQTISSTTADALGALLPGRSFSFTKPACCVIKVTTSIGAFTLGKGMEAYSTRLFDAPFTVDSVEVLSGGCALASINIIQN